MEDSRHVFQKKINDILRNNKKLYDSWCNYAACLLDSNFSGKGARHIKPKDVVNELIAKVLVGERNWNMKKVPDINRLMTMLIKSFVSNLTKKETKVINFADYYDDDEEMLEYIDSIHHTQPDRIEHELEMRENIRVCYDILEEAEDYEALNIMDYLRFGYKNYDIADELNIGINRVANSKKRIRNILSKNNINAWAKK
jgi:hypothetical protein